MGQILPTISHTDYPLIEGAPGKTSIFRWAGSKKKLINELKMASPTDYGRYIEPFLGSGVFYLHQDTKKAVLSDYNEHLIQAYAQVRDNPKSLWDKCVSIPSDKEAYYTVRALDPDALTEEDRAARFIYLNRYCFNGVYRTNLRGGFNVSRGEGSLGIPCWEVFKAFSEKLQGCILEVSDFERVINNAESGDFIYLDPPYIDLSKRDRGEYGVGSFCFQDLERLASSSQGAAQRGCKVLISYRDCEVIKELFSNWRLFPLEVSRSVSCKTTRRQKAREIFLASYL